MGVKTYKLNEGLFYSSYKQDCYIWSQCPKCGQEFYGFGYSLGYEWKDVSTGADKCHVCSSKILKDEHYSVWTNKMGADLESALSEKIKAYESEQVRASLDSLLAEIKPADDMPTDNEIALRAKSDISLLKGYIHQLIELEVWARFLKEHIVKLEEENSAAKKRSLYKSCRMNKSAEKEIARQEMSLQKDIEQLKYDFEHTVWVEKVKPAKIKAPHEPQYYPEEVPVMPVQPVLKKLGAFNKKKVTLENERLVAEYNQAVQIYNQKLTILHNVREINAKMRSSYEEQMEAYNRKLKEEQQRVKQMQKEHDAQGALKKQEAEKELNEKIAEIEKQIKELKKTTKRVVHKSASVTALEKEVSTCKKLLKTVVKATHELYRVNIIYPNYRDVIALSSFYEYLNSKRCDKFEGHDGAYNLYEAERRSNVISTLITTVEDINKNQVVLYKELTAMFENLKKLADILSKAVEATRKAESKKDQSLDVDIEETFKKYYAEFEGFKNRMNDSVTASKDFTVNT